MMGLVSLEEEETRACLHVLVLPLCHLRIQRDRGSLQAQNKVLAMNQLCQYLGLPSLQNYEKQ